MSEVLSPDTPALHQKQVVGAVFMTINSRFEFDIVVSKDHEGLGIGTSLVDFALNSFRNENVETCWVEIVNRKMERILLSKGFQIKKNDDEYKGENVIMTLDKSRLKNDKIVVLKGRVLELQES